MIRAICMQNSNFCLEASSARPSYSTNHPICDQQKMVGLALTFHLSVSLGRKNQLFFNLPKIILHYDLSVCIVTKLRI